MLVDIDKNNDISADQNQKMTCNHEQQIYFLQQKLGEVHAKLIIQLQICKQKQLEIVELNHIIKQERQERDRLIQTQEQKNIVIRCGIQQRFKDWSPDDSITTQTNLNKKITILEENLDAMRVKVMNQIKQKNQIKKKMNQIKINYQNQLKEQRQKFEGLEILYQNLFNKQSKNDIKILVDQKLVNQQAVQTYPKQGKGTIISNSSKQLKETSSKRRQNLERNQKHSQKPEPEQQGPCLQSPQTKGYLNQIQFFKNNWQNINQQLSSNKNNSLMKQKNCYLKIRKQNLY